MSSATVSELIAAPHFFDAVADRIWRAWHAPRGVTLAELRARLDENMLGRPTPKAFVAHDGARFLGTISLIASDLDQRPALTPWAAALWVEPEARGAGVGGALLDAAVAAALASGAEAVYLCAQEPLRAFYLGRSWRVIETDVGPRGLSVFRRTRAQEL